MTQPHSVTPESPTGHPAILVVVCSALFFGIVNGSAVAVVLPEIATDLNIEAADSSWILSGFLLTYGVAIPFYGSLASRFGASRLFLVGVAVFATGSLLSALATDLTTLLAARTIQAAGGAAVPGLGMTLTSRAFPEERRGFVLGIVSATMGVGAAAGPLAAGVISEIADWRYLFAASALSIITVPVGLKYLDRNEAVSDEPLDIAGGIIFGVGVAATLFFVTQGSQSGWTNTATLIAAAIAIISLVTFSRHQRNGENPFIPQTLLTNHRYVMLTLLGFTITFANLAAQIGYPFAFSELNGLTTLQIGLALVPAALVTAIVGVIAGRAVDKIGAVTPIRIGVLLMIASTFAISSTIGSSSVGLTFLAIPFAAGFALVNTPLATVVSLLVKPEDLASALSLNTMMFFIGGSFGATLFSTIVLNTTADANALNPLHQTMGAGFSNAFAALAIPLVIGLALTSSVRKVANMADGDTQRSDGIWQHDCQVPWCPGLEQELATTSIGETPS